GETARRIAHAVTRKPRYAAGPEAILHTRLTPVPLRVSDLMPHLGTAIDAVLARGMAEDPAKRHASATELLKDVAGALGVAWPDRAPAHGRPRLQLVTERMHPVPHVPASVSAGRPDPHAVRSRRPRACPCGHSRRLEHPRRSARRTARGARGRPDAERAG